MIPIAGRILAVDWGEVRIGLALSDETQTLASPLETLTRRAGKRFPMPRFLELVGAHRPVGVVVGLPLALDGTEGPSAVAARELAELIERRTGLPVELWDERLTTARALRAIREQAGSTRGRREDVDALAASVLLQHFLDARPRGGEEPRGGAPLAAFATLALLATLGCAGTNPTAERITIPPGATFAAVTDSLVAHDVVSNRFVFELQARLRRLDRSARAGVYEFPPNASTSTVLDMLAAGRVAAVRFTVPEGLTIPEVANLAEARLGVPADSVTTMAFDSTFADSLGIRAGSLEGFLRPETYALPIDVTARELVRHMVSEFESSWNPAWNARLDSLGMTRLELVTFASIVEGEARIDSERETIAGVYHNRMRIGMPLQADPTVQYAILMKTGKRKPRLFHNDYQIESPYNTYRNPGLPPGPVNSPSRRSIEAALYPADVPYLYFVAAPDGRHIFTRTYNEHLRAIARVRKR